MKKAFYFEREIKKIQTKPVDTKANKWNGIYNIHLPKV